MKKLLVHIVKSKEKGLKGEKLHVSEKCRQKDFEKHGSITSSIKMTCEATPPTGIL